LSSIRHRKFRKDIAGSDIGLEFSATTGALFEQYFLTAGACNQILAAKPVVNRELSIAKSTVDLLR